MAASLSGTKTCTKAASPQLTAARLTALLAIAPEDMKVSEFNELADALRRVSGGAEPATTISDLLP